MTNIGIGTGDTHTRFELEVLVHCTVRIATTTVLPRILRGATPAAQEIGVLHLPYVGFGEIVARHHTLSEAFQIRVRNTAVADGIVLHVLTPPTVGKRSFNFAGQHPSYLG
jgi:hypothetical protein